MSYDWPRERVPLPPFQPGGAAEVHSDLISILRSWLDNPPRSGAIDQLVLIRPPDEPARVVDHEFSPPPEVVVFYRRRMVGPAPYVGEPFVYLWDIALESGPHNGSTMPLSWRQIPVVAASDSRILRR